MESRHVPSPVVRSFVRPAAVLVGIAVITLMLTSPTAAAIRPTDLRCEAMTDPLGIDGGPPRLGWMVAAPAGARGVQQVAYQVLVASTRQLLDANTGDLWDSGRVASAQSVGVAYGGTPLRSGQRAYWKVRLWDEAAGEPAWGDVATWTAGLLAPEDWQPAKWVTLAATSQPQQPASVLLRREFGVKPNLARAVVFVTGLAQYELSLNGRKVGDQLISPGWSEFRKTVLYDAFDVTDLLRPGAANAAGIVLGHGMYHIEPTKGRYVKFTKSFGPLKAIAHLRLEYADGTSETVGTDASWQAATGPITYSNLFGGEDYDARLEPTGWDQPSFRPTSPWAPAVQTGGPGGALRGLSASAPPVKVIAAHPPVKVTPMRPGVAVYDLGQNASHMVTFTVRGPRGSYARAIPSELLGADGYVDRKSCTQDAGGPAWWQHTLAGTGAAETYVPKFFYQGCRYLQVECFPAEPGGPLPVVESLTGTVVHSSAAPIGSFECSNDLFNKTHALVRWAQRSNMMSLMTDCPHREKLGWLEELHLNGPSLRYNFALERLFAKQMNDMSDAQLANGFVPNIAPEYFLAHTDKLTDPFRNSVEWGSAFVIVPWQQYLFDGDVALLRRHYADMARYVDFVGSMTKDDIVQQGLGDWYDLGPKPPWGSQLTPPPFTGTAIYYYDLTVLAQASDLLGKPDAAAAYRQRAAEVRAAFNQKFYNPEKRLYATGSQCTSAMPLVLGLVEEENRAAVLQALIDDIRGRGNALSAGDVGYRFVLRALADAGRSDVVFDMNNQSDRPGYGMQIKKGATALTEKWDASVGNFGSHNHFMLGQINEWFFHDLAGIQPTLAAPGFEKVVIKPAPVGDVRWLKCTYVSPRGPINVEWRREDAGGLTLDVTIPHNATATVHVPTSTPANVTEGDKPAAQAAGVTVQEPAAGHAVFAVGSGSYRFRADQ